MMIKTLLLGLVLVVTVFSHASSYAALAQARQPTLAGVVKVRPFPDYARWWRIGSNFSTFMSDAIVSEWTRLPGNDGDLAPVRRHVSEYVKTVYQREARPSLVEDFRREAFAGPLQSGEFDALSYGFFRSAFELIDRHRDRYVAAPEVERRLFTKRVGKRFFGRVHDHLGLRLPARLEDEMSVAALKTSIAKVVAFLTDEGYFRDRAVFRFDVNVPRTSGRIVQPESAVLDRLERDGRVYALFEMSYPVILPSAVYLFQTVGEAQHHSSRTIEELFDRIGYVASETSDFDPSGFPSDMVVELWQIEVRSKP